MMAANSSGSTGKRQTGLASLEDCLSPAGRAPGSPHGSPHGHTGPTVTKTPQVADHSPSSVSAQIPGPGLVFPRLVQKRK